MVLGTLSPVAYSGIAVHGESVPIEVSFDAAVAFAATCVAGGEGIMAES